MDIENLRKMRTKLEQDILANISELVEDFRRLTGFCPHNICVDMVQIQEIGEHEPQYIVG